MAETDLQQALEIARQHDRAGRLLQAETICRHLLVKQPGDAQTLHLSGILAAKSGHYDRAADLLRQAVAAHPRWAEALFDLGNILQFRKHFDQAIAAYRQSLAVKADWPEAWNNLGVALKEDGQLDAAITALNRAITLRPDHAAAWCNLGNACKSSGRIEQSATAYHRAIAINADLAEAHNNLAVVLKDLGDLDGSMRAGQRAIALRPGFAEAHNNLGATLEELGKLDLAEAAYQRAIGIIPAYAEAHYNLGNICKSKGRLKQAIAFYRKAMSLRPGFVEAYNNFLYAIHFDPQYNAQAIAEEHQRWNQQYAEPLKRFIPVHLNDRTGDRRLRIGYVSPDFKEHPVGRFLLPLLDKHDRTQFEIFAYSQVSIADSLTEKLRMHTDAWKNIVGFSDSQVAELIVEDRIDILVDLTMHMARNRMMVFARKPAPVQLTWLAYCSTTGLQTIDYRLSDSYLDPMGADLSIYSEQTVCLPETYWCYQPVEDSPEVNTLPAITSGCITFGSLNNFGKVNESVLTTWASLLMTVENSRLVLHAPEGEHRDQVLDHMHRLGVRRDRIQFVGKTPVREYLRFYNQIDIALDTFPYAGGTTTFDSLWMGVPVVSLIGKTAVGRGGLSILSNLGLAEWAADSQNQYVQIAADFSNDLPRLSELRATLRQRMKRSCLMDAMRFANAIETVYRRIWHTWCKQR